MAADKKRCFIIMPISTPKAMEEKYSGGAEHFDHVYECLFEPSVKEAGYTPIPPTFGGSVNIQASIVKNLETAGLVLCDMSCLNPNVFFEWGIRTSLNKPVCIVKDELTKGAPFDMSTLHHHTYSSGVELWNIEDERKKLMKHIQATIEKSSGVNELWSHFEVTAAQPFKAQEGEQSELAYLAMQMESLQRKFDSVIVPNRMVQDEASVRRPLRHDMKRTEGQDRAMLCVEDISRERGKMLITVAPHQTDHIRVLYAGPADGTYEKEVRDVVEGAFCVRVEFECMDA